MRLFLAIAFALLLLNSGCIFREDAASNQPLSSGPYTGFPDYEPGMWVTYRIFGGSMINFEVVGKDTFDDREALGFEMSVRGADGSTTQVWFLNTGELVKYVIKQQGQVTCVLELGTVNRAALPFVGDGWKSTPPEFEAEREYEDVHSTPRGGKVRYTRFSSPIGEAWVSGDVPFGIVMEIQDEDVIFELYDFGLTGAEREISMEELENCWEFDVKRAIPQYR